MWNQKDGILLHITLSFLTSEKFTRSCGSRLIMGYFQEHNSSGSEGGDMEFCPRLDSRNWCQRSASHYNRAIKKSCHTHCGWMVDIVTATHTHTHAHESDPLSWGKHTQILLTQASELLTWPPLARFSRRIQVAFISHTGHSVSWTTAPSSPAVTTLNCTAVLSCTSAVPRQLRLQVHSTLWAHGLLAPVTPGL